MALALLLRVGVVVGNRNTYAPLNDALDFDNVASSIADGHGYGPYTIPPAVGTGAFRSPAYPVVLAAVYAVVGNHSWTWGRLENAVLGVVVVAMIGLVASQLFSRRTAAVAMAIAAVHPTLILVGSGLQLEPLLVSLSLGALAAALQHRRTPRGWRWPVLAGVLLGLAILTREVGFALVLPIAWLLLPEGLRGRERLSRRALWAPVAFVAVAAAVVVPWTIRNAVRFHAFEPVSSSSGFGLAGTYNTTSLHNRGEWVRPYDDPELLALMETLHEPDEAELDKVLRKAATDFMKEHPAYVTQVAFWGSIRLLDLDGGAYDRHIAKFVPYSQKLMWASIIATYVLFVLAIVGATTKRVRAVPRAVWVIPLLIFLEIVFLLPANVRYRSSIEPFLVMVGAVGLVTIVEGFWPRARAIGQPAPNSPDPVRPS